MAQKRNHEDTWGASEEAKQEWEADNGDTARKSTERETKKRGKEQNDA